MSSLSQTNLATISRPAEVKYSSTKRYLIAIGTLIQHALRTNDEREIEATAKAIAQDACKRFNV